MFVDSHLEQIKAVPALVDHDQLAFGQVDVIAAQSYLQIQVVPKFDLRHIEDETISLGRGVLHHVVQRCLKGLDVLTVILLKDFVEVADAIQAYLVH